MFLDNGSNKEQESEIIQVVRNAATSRTFKLKIKTRKLMQCVSFLNSNQYAAFLSHKSCERLQCTGRKAKSQYVVICAIFFLKIKDITIQ